MSRTPIYEATIRLRKLVESFGPPIIYRKLNGIVNALEMQVEEGTFSKHAVTRLCEALLASAADHDIGDNFARLEELACRVVDLAQTPGR